MSIEKPGGNGEKKWATHQRTGEGSSATRINLWRNSKDHHSRRWDGKS